MPWDPVPSLKSGPSVGFTGLHATAEQERKTIFTSTFLTFLRNWKRRARERAVPGLTDAEATCPLGH